MVVLLLSVNLYSHLQLSSTIIVTFTYSCLLLLPSLFNNPPHTLACCSPISLLLLSLLPHPPPRPVLQYYYCYSYCYSPYILVCYSPILLMLSPHTLAYCFPILLLLLLLLPLHLGLLFSYIIITVIVIVTPHTLACCSPIVLMFSPFFLSNIVNCS